MITMKFKISQQINTINYNVLRIFVMINGSIVFFITFKVNKSEQ